MTDLRMFTTARIECNPHDATRPTAKIGVRVSDKADVQLGLHWSDGAPRAQWAITVVEQSSPGDGWGYSSLLRDMFRGPTAGEEWKNEKPDAATAPAPTEFPRSTEVIARLLPLALAWESSPVRSADRLARLVAVTLGARQEAA